MVPGLGENGAKGGGGRWAEGGETGEETSAIFTDPRPELVDDVGGVYTAKYDGGSVGSSGR